MPSIRTNISSKYTTTLVSLLLNLKTILFTTRFHQSGGITPPGTVAFVHELLRTVNTKPKVYNSTMLNQYICWSIFKLLSVPNIEDIFTLLKEPSMSINETNVWSNIFYMAKSQKINLRIYLLLRISCR